MVVNNRATQYPVLKVLINDYYPAIRYAAIQHPNMPSEALAELANSSDWRAREAVAKNNNTSTDTLIQLSDDPYWPVCRAVAKRTGLPPEVYAKLAKHKNSYVSNQAKNMLARYFPSQT
jgi:hypothetical protein